MKIDAHHHFWKYSPAEYGWIDESMNAIRRDFLPGDLKALIDAVGIDAVVSVQARQTIEETRCLLEMADENDFIRGVVGWVPLICPTVSDSLAQFASNSKLKAVRHVLQDEADENYMLRGDFNKGIAALRRFDLVYDVLIFERHLPQTIKFVDKHPQQVFVLDHVAKPEIRHNVLDPWRENIQVLARRENVYCKLSGLVTEANHRSWTPDQLRPYVEVVLEAFGANRIMFGSDWPVCLLACEYKRWFSIVTDFISTLSPAEQKQVLGETAIRAYRL
ncbi:MAG: amidohydrolase family protein [Planctomycetes bacterium]|nr:amidohydrolase family protein [Planctomycetota bacterium]